MKKSMFEIVCLRIIPNKFMVLFFHWRKFALIPIQSFGLKFSIPVLSLTPDYNEPMIFKGC